MRHLEPPGVNSDHVQQYLLYCLASRLSVADCNICDGIRSCEILRLMDVVVPRFGASTAFNCFALSASTARTDFVVCSKVSFGSQRKFVFSCVFFYSPLTSAQPVAGVGGCIVLWVAEQRPVDLTDLSLVTKFLAPYIFAAPSCQACTWTALSVGVRVASY